MKKLLLSIICALSALAGAAQTGVGVSNFNANTGTSATTATFTVSWTSAGNDSVWVFVDYNTAGTMKRLPLTTATASAGAVRRPNEWGAWVVAPAGAGEFATTVTLSSGTTYSYGSCAYAIPQPPKGEYTAFNAIKFTGTPPFVIKLKGGGSATVASSPYTYTPVPNDPPASFTDATLAPGVITCTPPTITRQPASKTACSGSPTRVDIATTPAAAYQWYENGAAIPEGNGGTANIYTTASLNATTTYKVTATVGACSVTSNEAVVSITDCSAMTCTPPEAIVTFANFKPCESAATGTTWYLTDTREPNNLQTYKVRKMPNGTIWMVQDLKFGDKCDNILTHSSTADQQGKVTTTNPNHYGDCRTNTTPGTGYRYDLAAAMNAPGWYSSATTTPVCVAGTNCQGVCPAGWRVPAQGSFIALESGLGYKTGDDLCPIFNESIFEGSGACCGACSIIRVDYFSSSTEWYQTWWFAYSLGYELGKHYLDFFWSNYANTPDGAWVRCIRN